MPLFSGEIDAYGNVDKSKRSMDLSEKIIGGMGNTRDYEVPVKGGKYGETKIKTVPLGMKYGGMPTYQGKMPKAELGMGQGLISSSY